VAEPSGQSGDRDRFQGGGAEFAQDVEGATGELAGDCQRGAGVAEAAGLEREIVGVIGAAVPTGRQGRLS
jgi:hypothetical protein